MTAPSVRAELAAAVRKVNAEYSRLPRSAQDRIEVRADPVEAAVNSSILAGDRERALAAVAAWRSYWLRRFEEATK